MKKIMGVANTDQVNKYNVRFTISALESAYADMWNTGVPSFLNHDHEKPIAWCTVAALFFEPGQVSTITLSHMPESESEQLIVQRMIKKYYTNATSDFISQYRSELHDAVKEHIVGEHKYCATESAAIINDGIVERLFPSLFKDADKHGLVELSKLKQLAPGIFEINGLVVYASPFFRRSFSRLNTLNTPFLRRFSEVAGQGNAIAKIAIDRDMIGLAKSVHEVFEFSYWWGPKFNESLDEIHPGVTQHKNDETNTYFSDIDRTDFWWYVQDNRKTFECEEVITQPSLGISNADYGCRFVHSMIDVNSNEPFHLDGAIRLYTEDKILSRWDNDLSTSGKDTDYNKIWRLDGSIKVSEWKELITHYYRDNMLIGEYFDGEDEKKDFKPATIKDFTNEHVLLSDFVPTHMQIGDGVRLAVSYHPNSSRGRNGRKIRALNMIELNGIKEKYVESDAFELIKALKRHGEPSSAVIGGIKHLAFEDTIINFPLVQHFGTDAVSQANLTLRAICDLCRAWNSGDTDRAITFSIAIEYQSKEVHFSFAGHVQDLYLWISGNKISFPENEAQMSEWSEKAAEYLLKDFSNTPANPGLGNLLRENGLLHFQRYFLPQEMYTAYFDKEKQALSVQMILPENEQLMLKAIEKRSCK